MDISAHAVPRWKVQSLPHFAMADTARALSASLKAVTVRKEAGLMPYYSLSLSAQKPMDEVRGLLRALELRQMSC